MKTLLALFLLTMTTLSMGAESCTYVVKNSRGFEYETLTRYGYSRYEACNDASYACREAIANGQVYGRYYDAYCEEKFDNYPTPPMPPSQNYTCNTDLVDYYGNTIRSFSANGRTEGEACRQSDQFCQYELSRQTSYGYRCVTRGNGGGGGGYPPPRPPRQTTERCTASRFDPAGFFIESYTGIHTGPIGTDVRGEACRIAMNNCSIEIRGRQSCRITQ